MRSSEEKPNLSEESKCINAKIGYNIVEKASKRFNCLFILSKDKIKMNYKY